MVRTYSCSQGCIEHLCSPSTVDSDVSGHLFLDKERQRRIQDYREMAQVGPIRFQPAPDFVPFIDEELEKRIVRNIFWIKFDRLPRIQRLRRNMIIGLAKRVYEISSRDGSRTGTLYVLPNRPDVSSCVFENEVFIKSKKGNPND